MAMTHDDKPPDIQVKATYQLPVEPIYLGLLQLKLKIKIFKKKQTHGIRPRFISNSITLRVIN